MAPTKFRYSSLVFKNLYRNVTKSEKETMTRIVFGSNVENILLDIVVRQQSRGYEGQETVTNDAKDRHCVAMR